MGEAKVPMPASGRESPKTRGDGVDQVDTGGRSSGGETGGGSYENPHTGKEARGEGGSFDGGQSVKGYHGPGQLDGKDADSVDSNGGGEADELSQATPDAKPHRVSASGRTFEVVQESGIAEAEVSGKVGTDAAYEAEQQSPGSG